MDHLNIVQIDSNRFYIFRFNVNEFIKIYKNQIT